MSDLVNDGCDLDAIRWNDHGLVAAIAQDATTQRVLMMAWMNREALIRTIADRQMVYWSRSRQRLWRKGESSGNVQRLLTLRLDCDGDALLAGVEQLGAGTACHTGRTSCFYRALDRTGRWTVEDPVVIDPARLYRQSESSS